MYLSEMNAVAKKLGFKLVSVTPHEPKNNDACNVCCEIIASHTAVFSCGHYSCTKCVDTLADGFTDDSADILFICPVCQAEINNVFYQ